MDRSDNFEDHGGAHAIELSIWVAVMVHEPRWTEQKLTATFSRGTDDAEIAPWAENTLVLGVLALLARGGSLFA